MNKLKLESYKWVRVGKGEIPLRQVTRNERRIARELEAEYLKTHGIFPTGFTLKGGGVGWIHPEL